MNLISAEQRERSGFIERTIEAAKIELADPTVAHAMGGVALALSSQLDNFSVASIRGSEVTLDGIEEDSSLVVFVLKPEDVLRLSHEFDIPTPAQLQNFAKKFEGWAPKYMDTVHALSLDVARPGVPIPQIQFSAQTSSMTGMLAEVHTPTSLGAYFADAPKSELVIFRKRPVLLYIAKDINSFMPPYVTVHELAHYNQAENDPVTAFKSQNNVNMQSLRDELEAYGISAPIVFKEIAKHPVEELPNLDGTLLVSAAVENLRLQNLVDPTDPFKPSGFLLQKLKEKGVGGILHMAIDFDGYTNLANQHRD